MYFGGSPFSQLEKAMTTHSSTLAWNIPWMEEPGGLQSMGSLGVGRDWLHFHFSLLCIGEGNGNPLQCSCLENPRDRGAWWAAVYGVTQSRTWLMWLSSSSSSIQSTRISEVRFGASVVWKKNDPDRTLRVKALWCECTWNVWRTASGQYKWSIIRISQGD